MLDKDLQFADNERPAITPFATYTQPWLFPDNLNPKHLDLRVATDLARSSPLYANFIVRTSFDNVVGNFLRFCVFVDSSPTFANVLGNAELTIARSQDFASLVLVGGTQCTIVVPPLSDITKVAGEGRRYLTLGLQTLVPTTDWSAGGIDAFLTRHPLPQRPMSYASGY